MKAYLYDFDKTICAGDSGSKFWKFCLVRSPWIILCLPVQIVGGVCKLLGIFEKLQRVCSIHCYVSLINTGKAVQRFWEKNKNNIYPYFYERKRDLPTVVCSASPDFLLKPICDMLGVDVLICTVVSPKTGRIMSDTCIKAQKVVRIEEDLPEYEFSEVYSDSLKNDIYILRLGEKAFIVKDGVVTEAENLVN